MKRAVLVAAVAAGLTVFINCSDDPHAPATREDPTPTLMISDATRGGNPHFYLLPPLGPVPAEVGTFDPSLHPVVEICKLGVTTCDGPPLVTITDIQLEPDAARYVAVWNLASAGLREGKLYRIRVLAGGAELGFADIMPKEVVGTQWRLSHALTQLADGASAHSKATFEVPINGMLPIAFRIDEGAVFVPTALFTTAGSTQARSATTFDAGLSIDPTGEGLTYAWDFGDGGRGSGEHAAHVYTAAGAYFATLVVTTTAGVHDAFTQRVRIGAPPEPVGMATLTGHVTETTGEALEGVDVRVVGGSAQGTTNAAGEVTLGGVGTGISVLLRLARAGFAEQFVEVEIPAGATAAGFDAAMQRRAPSIQASAVQGGADVTGEHGVSVELPPNALVHQDGSPVTGTVDIALTPIDVTQPDGGGFPGGFSAVQSDGSSADLLSFGVAEFVITQDGEELQLALGQTATIEIPIYTGGASPGDVLPLWSLDEATGMWVEEGTGVVVASTASPTGLALRADVSHFSWWNIDITMNPFMPFVRCVFGGAPVGCSVRGTVLNPPGPTRTAVDVLPPGGKTLNSPPNVDVLIEAVGTSGEVFGSAVVNGPPGATPEVIINVGDPFLPRIRCVDNLGTPSVCTIHGVMLGAPVLYENVPVGGRTVPVAPNQDVTIQAFGPSGNGGQIIVNGPVGGTTEYVIMMGQLYTPTVRCTDRLGNPTFCRLSWTLPGFGPTQTLVPAGGRTINLPPNLSVLVTAADVANQWTGVRALFGPAGGSPAPIVFSLTMRTCGGTPNAFPLVIVTLVNPCSAPGIVATATEALALVQPGGEIRFGAGTHTVTSLPRISKPVLLQNEPATSPVLQFQGVGFPIRIGGISLGTVTIRGLRITGGDRMIFIESPYDQVVVENSTIIVGGTAGIEAEASTVAGSRVIIRENTFSYVGAGLMAVFGHDANALIDVLDNVSTGPSGWAFVQFQGGATGRIEGNVATECGAVGCINAFQAAGVVIRNNNVSASATTNVRDGIVWIGNATAAATITDNTVNGGISGGPPADPESYAYSGEGINVSGGSPLLVDVSRNTISGAVTGLQVGNSITGRDNVISNVRTGLLGPVIGVSSLRNNDFTNYVTSLSGVFGGGSMTCNWWGNPAGPQNVGATVLATSFTPWATAPIANGAGGLCNGM